MTKRFRPKELVARIKAFLRRAEVKKERQKVYYYDKLTLDLSEHQLTYDDKTA